MTEKVTISLVENLPMPLIWLASPEDLAQWYVGQLQWAWDQGQRELAVSCFDTGAMGFEVARAAYVVLKALTDFLYDHPELHVRMVCHGEDTLRAYQLDWNMFYQETKPQHHHD